MIHILTRNAQCFGQKLAVVSPGESLTHAQLLDRVLAEAEQLRHGQCAERGQICQFVASQDAAYLVRFLALHLVGAICAPVGQQLTLPSYCNPAVSDLLFTTGSTSQPKGVLLSPEAVLADAENLVEAHHYQEDLTFIICGPIHHFGCWSKVLPTLLVGGTLYLLEGLKDQEQLFAALGSAPRTATFSVPSAIRMLLQFSSARLHSLRSHIDFIETGAAPISTRDMEQLRQLLPHTRLYNTYASTETGVVCTYPFHLDQTGDSPLVAGCVGRPMRHARIRLDDAGHIVVGGKMIMTGYLHEAVGEGFVPPTEIVTSDIGSIDSEGNLIITGRDSEFINVGGLKVAPSEVEEAVMAYPGVADCICVPASHLLMGQVPRLLVVMQPGQPFDRKALILHLKSRLATYKLPLLYEEVDEVRKTFNGKKDRKAY